jgi:hypothetical protein
VHIANVHGVRRNLSRLALTWPPCRSPACAVPCRA